MGDKVRKIRGDDPKLNERRPMKGERRLDIDGERWGWRMGSGYVVVVGPKGSKAIVSDFAVSRSWEAHDRSEEIVPVTPGRVEEYIRANLLPEYCAH